MADTISPIRSSTQLFTEIADVDRDLVLFSDGSVALVIATTAVNFGLLSEKEQDAIIYAYAGLLNSLSFPIQLIIQTIHKDISAYLGLLEDKEKTQKNPKLAKSIHSYRAFVSSMVKEKVVLDKKFYIVLPFTAIELGISASPLFNSKKSGLPFDKSYILDRAEIVLIPKKDHLVRLLARVGLRASQLSSEQLIKLYFNAYNAGSPSPDVSHFVAKKENHVK